MQEKYKDKGVVLVALTDETSQTVARFASNMKINYLVGAQGANTRSSYGCRSYPTVYVIDPDGKVAYFSNDAHSAEKVVDRLLKEKPPKIARSVAERFAEERLTRADALLTEKKDVEALHEFQKIVEEFGDAPVAKDATKRIEALKANPNLGELIKQAEAKAKLEAKCNRLLHLARALANAGHGGQAVTYYDQVTKDCDDTEFAKLAVSERASLNAPRSTGEAKSGGSQ